MAGRMSEVDEAIAYIHKHIYDPLTMSQLAKYVGYSPFHFIRLFKAQTGLTPQYFISSVRLQKAKELLIHTRLPIRDIAEELGQRSLGTFTTRFTEKVGATPAVFRSQKEFAENHLQTLRSLNGIGAKEAQDSQGAAIYGQICAEVPIDGVVFIGLFPKPIPDSMPIYGTVLLSLGDFRFSNVRPGTYFLMATSVTWQSNASDLLLPQTTLRTRRHEPITVESPNAQIYKQVTLYSPRIDDPPILISLPILMSRFLARMKSV